MVETLTTEEYRLIAHFHQESALCRYSGWGRVERKLRTHDPEILNLIRDCDSLEATFERRKQTLYAQIQNRIEKFEGNT